MGTRASKILLNRIRKMMRFMITFPRRKNQFEKIIPRSVKKRFELINWRLEWVD